MITLTIEFGNAVDLLEAVKRLKDKGFDVIKSLKSKTIAINIDDILPVKVLLREQGLEFTYNANKASAYARLKEKWQNIDHAIIKDTASGFEVIRKSPYGYNAIDRASY